MNKTLNFHVYRPGYMQRPLDPSRCAAAVGHAVGASTMFTQCRSRGRLEYATHKWCKLHFPPNVEAKRNSRYAARRAENAAKMAKWNTQRAEEALKDRALDAIRKIAAGHNDPRGLAKKVLKP